MEASAGPVAGWRPGLDWSWRGYLEKAPGYGGSLSDSEHCNVKTVVTEIAGSSCACSRFNHK